MHAKPLALTLDLDDTLWPIWPTIDKAETTLHDWMRQHAPATAVRFDRAALRALRNEVAASRTDWAHDLSAIRQESLRQALLQGGEDPALAVAAFEVFFEARQQVVLFEDALAALDRLATRYTLLALTNGNADLSRIAGLAPLFKGSVTARDLGVAKPDARIFHHACGRLGHAPADVLHVGDDFDLDVAGALAAGLQAAWVRREPTDHLPPEGAGYRVYRDMTALADALLG
jgi:putative hydrolase of the HAD superfamily